MIPSSPDPYCGPLMDWDYSSMSSSSPVAPSNTRLNFVGDENLDTSLHFSFTPSPQTQRTRFDALKPNGGNATYPVGAVPNQVQLLNVIKSASFDALLQSGNLAFSKVHHKNIELATALQTTKYVPTPLSTILTTLTKVFIDSSGNCTTRFSKRLMPRLSHMSRSNVPLIPRALLWLLLPIGLSCRAKTTLS